MARKRVVFFVENYVYGGLERFLFDTIESLPSEWEVSLLHNDYPGFAERLAARVRRPVRRIVVPIASRPIFVDRYSRYFPRLLVRAAARLAARFLARRHFEHNRAAIGRALDSLGPADVLHMINGGYPGAESVSAAARAGAERVIPRRIVSILSCHAPAFMRPPEHSAERSLFSDVDVFVTNSEAARRSLIQYRGFPPHRVVTVHTGVSTARPDAANARRLREAWLRGGNILVGCLGALRPLKGHRFLIDAMPAVLARFPGLRLVLVGDGESAADLKAQSRAIGVGDAVSFPGYLDGDPVDALAAFDVLAHPTSETEGLPYAVLEAMSLGKPIVATAVGGVPEAVEDRVTGLIAPPASAPALAEALAALAGDPGLARRLGETAERRQRERFSLESASAGMLALYEGATPARAAVRS